MVDTPGTLEERLRRNSGWRNERHQCVTDPNLLTEAADEIASLRARVEALREALREMVDSCIWGPVPGGDGETFIVNPPTTTALKRARQALKDTPDA